MVARAAGAQSAGMPRVTRNRAVTAFCAALTLAALGATGAIGSGGEAPLWHPPSVSSDR
jgi:hypothetical protein